MLRQTTGAIVFLSAGLLLLLTGCEAGSTWEQDAEPVEARRTPSDPQQQTLYARLGGEEGIRKVVDDLVALGAANPAVNFTRQGHPNQWQPTEQNVKLLKDRLVEFVGSTTGGPQIYRGKDMVSAHQGMEITEAEFDAFAGDLKRALDMNKVPQREQKELIDIVAGTRSAIVQAEKNR